MKKRIYNQTALFGPLHAYLVVVSPPQWVRGDVAKIKKELNAIAGIGERNLQSIAHITLFDKLTDDTDLAATVAERIKEKRAFYIAVKGWGIFDHGHSATIYLAVENPAPIANLAAEIQPGSISPHISLAKKISHEAIEKLMPYLENLEYSAEWMCTEVQVLRKLMAEKHLGFRESVKIPLLDKNQ